MPDGTKRILTGREAETYRMGQQLLGAWPGIKKTAPETARVPTEEISPEGLYYFHEIPSPYPENLGGEEMGQIVELLRALLPYSLGPEGRTIKDNMGYEYSIVYDPDAYNNIVLVRASDQLEIPVEHLAVIRQYTSLTAPMLRVQVQEAQRGAIEEENLRREAEGLEPIELPTPTEQYEQYMAQKQAAAMPLAGRPEARMAPAAFPSREHIEAQAEAPLGTQTAGQVLQDLYGYAQYHNRALAGQPKPPIYSPDTGEMEETGVYEAIPIEGIQALITQHNEAMQIQARQARAQAEAAQYRFPAPPPRPQPLAAPDLGGVPNWAVGMMGGQPTWTSQLPSHEQQLFARAIGGRGPILPGMEQIQPGYPPWASPYAREEQVWSTLSPATKAMFWETGGKGRLGERTSLTPWFEAGAAPSAPALTGRTWAGPGFAEPPAWAAGSIGALAGVNWTI